MKKIILFLTAFSACSSFAQKASPGDIKQLFGDKTKNDIEWNTPGLSSVGKGSYFIEGDTLYACLDLFEKCIAVEDIDFTNKSVRTHEYYYVNNTADKVYILTLSPVKGKKTGSGFYIQGDAITMKLNSDPVELYMKNMEQADAAFQYLKTWKKGDSAQKLKKPKKEKDVRLDALPPPAAGPFDSLLADEKAKEHNQAIGKIPKADSDGSWALETNDADTKTPPEETKRPVEDMLKDSFTLDFSSIGEPKKEKTAEEIRAAEELRKNTYTIDFSSISGSKTQISTTESATGFDPQLSELIEGYKNGWGTLKGAPLKNGEYQSKSNLPGSVTKIGTGLIGEYTMLADFGEYGSKAEAQKVYEEVVSKVEAAKIPFTTVKQDEYVSALGKTTVWLTFGAPAGYEKMSIWVETMESRKFDKNLNSSIVYFVVLRIEDI